MQQGKRLGWMRHRTSAAVDKIDHLAPERGTIEGVGEDADDQAEPVTLVLANREQIAPRRVSDR